MVECNARKMLIVMIQNLRWKQLNISVWENLNSETLHNNSGLLSTKIAGSHQKEREHNNILAGVNVTIQLWGVMNVK